MGAVTFVSSGIGETAKTVFGNLVEDARFMSGSGGYSGTIAEKDGFTMVDLPKGKNVHEFIDQKIDENEKWGPAFCVEMATTGAEKEFIFFGWASS